MQTSDEKVATVPLLTQKNISTIKLFCSVARAKNAPLSLRELLSLASLDLTEDELARAWENCGVLNNEYAITGGLIAERNGGNKQSTIDNQTESFERFSRAESNIFYATRFNALLRDNYLKVLAISGSTSYLSVSREDYSISFSSQRKIRCGLALQNRYYSQDVFKLTETNAPSLCLSFVADERFTEEQFATNHDGLIARDAVSARVVRGESYYNDLLKRSKWIAEYFPKLYELRFGNGHDRRPLERGEKTQPYIPRESDCQHVRLLHDGCLHYYQVKSAEPKVGKDGEEFFDIQTENR